MSSVIQEKVSEILGYKVDGRDFIITNDDVKHIIDEHGDPEAELKKEISRLIRGFLIHSKIL